MVSLRFGEFADSIGKRHCLAKVLEFKFANEVMLILNAPRGMKVRLKRACLGRVQRFRVCLAFRAVLLS
jgi:hypothetical protein